MMIYCSDELKINCSKYLTATCNVLKCICRMDLSGPAVLKEFLDPDGFIL